MSKTTLLALMLVFAVSGHAQTLGGTKPGDDFDGDGVINSADLDGDNDGVLDEVEKQKIDFAFSGFEPLFPSTLPSADDSGLRLEVGNRAIVRDALSYLGVKYHAIVEIKSAVLNSGAKVVITSKDELAIQDGNCKDNPHFTFTLNFVSSVGFIDSNYQNNNPITDAASIPNVNVTFADVDGASTDKGQGEVVGYKSVSTITRSPLVGANLNFSSIGFEYPAPGGGPGAGVYNYYRPKLTNGTSGAGPGNASNTDIKNWLTIYYDTFTLGEYVFGLTGPDDRSRPEAGPFFRLENIDIADVDGDTFDNVYDLDSDGDGCSDSNEAYADVTKANPGYQYGNPTIGTNPIPGGLGGIATTDDGDDWTINEGKVVAATYTTTTAQYKPAVTVTIVNKPADVQLLLNQTTATFTTSAKDLNNNETASGAQTYKWQQQLNGASWNDITVDASGTAIINGVTYSIDPFDTSTLNISDITSALHNSNYRAVMSDATYLVCVPKTSLAGNLRLAVPPNPLPIAVDDSYTVAEDGTVTLTPLSGDSDPAFEPLTLVSIGGTNRTPGVAQSIVVTNGTVNITAGGVITFTPTSNYFNTVVAPALTPIVFPYEITDGTSTVTANQIISVTSVNDAPVAVADSETAKEDLLFTSTVSLIANDSDPVEGDALSAVNGTFPTAKGGTLVLASDGTYTYMSALNFNGTDTVNYTVKDVGGATAVGTLTITVDPINDAPVAVNDNAIVAVDATSVIIQVASNDTDVDGNTNPVTDAGVDVASIDLDPTTPAVDDKTFTVVNEGTYVANANGTVTFSPVTDFTGTATPLNYTIKDLAGLVSNNIAQIKVSVNADSDGDGVLDETEKVDGTDPLDPCISIPANATEPKTADFSACDIVIYSAVSPNGDANNEYFKIKNIEKYSNNTLQIFDRWGVVVYEADGYGQPGKLFEGQSEGRSTVSASGQLPVGTYFYALKYVDALGASQERSGYLYINR